MTEKITTESLIEAMQKLYEIPFCKHCEVNPDAKKPYNKRTEIEVTELTQKIMDKLKKESGIPEECIWCMILSRFMHLSPEQQREELLKYHPTLESPKARVKQVMLDKETIDFAEKHGIDINEAVKQHLERLKAKFGN